MRRRSTCSLVAVVAALALSGCGRAAEPADRREERAAEVTADAQAGDDLSAQEGGADAIESALDEIDALLTED